METKTETEKHLIFSHNLAKPSQKRIQVGTKKAIQGGPENRLRKGLFTDLMFLRLSLPIFGVRLFYLTESRKNLFSFNLEHSIRFMFMLYFIHMQILHKISHRQK